MPQDLITMGIDFGTTNSVMAWFNHRTNAVEVIRNSEQEEVTPSVAYYDASETLIGQSALDQLESQLQPSRDDVLEKFVGSIKRRLGSRQLIPLPDGRELEPVNVVADILEKLRLDAQVEHFNAPPTHAVLTHPAAFSAQQSQLLIAAAKQAGFEEVELLAEPEAAAMHFANTGVDVGDGVLVYDIGGGTFDLAFVARDSTGRYRLAMEQDGDPHCGGDDFDLELYQFWNEQIEATGNPICAVDGQIDRHFLHQCRRRKENLSIRERPAPFHSHLSDGRIVDLEIDRATFEKLIKSHVDRTVDRTRRMYDRVIEAGHTVDTLLLIGGAARVPLIRQSLADALQVEPRQWSAQGIAVASGAAAVAHQTWAAKPASVNTIEPKPVQPNDEDRRWTFIDILNRCFGGIPNLYIAPSIPEAKLNGVQDLYAGEDILLVYDYTFFGSALDGFVITRNGVGWRNGFDCDPRLLAFDSIASTIETADVDIVLATLSRIKLADDAVICTWDGQSAALAAAFSKAVPQLMNINQANSICGQTRGIVR